VEELIIIWGKSIPAHLAPEFPGWTAIILFASSYSFD